MFVARKLVVFDQPAQVGNGFVPLLEGFGVEIRRQPIGGVVLQVDAADGGVEFDDAAQRALFSDALVAAQVQRGDDPGASAASGVLWVDLPGKPIEGFIG